MQVSHMEAVSQTVARAYRDVVRRLYGEAVVSLYQARSANKLELMRQAFPQGCLVATEGESVVGAIFARKWGQLGWFSSLGVEPEFQGRGIGKGLACAASRFLRESGCHTVGLETWTNSPAYTALYVGLGFLPVAINSQLVIDTHRGWSMDWKGRIVDFDELPEALRDQVKPATDSISDKLVAGMSMVEEIVEANRSTEKLTTWLVKEGVIRGVGLLDLNPDFDSTAMHSDLRIAILDPVGTEASDFLALLERVALYACEAGRTRLNVDVSSDYPHTFKLLLESGFTAVNQLTRFVDNRSYYQGVADRAVVNIGRWAT